MCLQQSNLGHSQQAELILWTCLLTASMPTGSSLNSRFFRIWPLLPYCHAPPQIHSSSYLGPFSPRACMQTAPTTCNPKLSSVPFAHWLIIPAPVWLRPHLLQAAFPHSPGWARYLSSTPPSQWVLSSQGTLSVERVRAQPLESNYLSLSLSPDIY